MRVRDLCGYPPQLAPKCYRARLQLLLILLEVTGSVCSCWAICGSFNMVFTRFFSSLQVGRVGLNCEKHGLYACQWTRLREKCEKTWPLEDDDSGERRTFQSNAPAE